MPTYTTLRYIADASGELLVEALKDNLISFFNWALLEAQAFVNVPVVTPGSNDPYADERLLPVHDQSLIDGQVWEAVKSNWIWEVGVDVFDPPVVVSGVYVNGVFYPTATTIGQFQHTINFPEGRVAFLNPIDQSSVVQAAYSYRMINFYNNEEPWFRNVVFNAYLTDPANNDQPSLLVAILQQHRVQLPMVIIEPVMTRRTIGYGLGGGDIVLQDILFHIVAENGRDRNNIMDVLLSSQNKTIYLYNVNARAANNDFALNWDGSLRPNAKMYPDLVDFPPVGYRWKRCVFNRMIGQDVSAMLPLYRGIVRATMEVNVGPT